MKNWWNKKKNKEYFELPISVIESDGTWIVTCNDETKLFLGDRLHACASGKSKEEAINKMFMMIRHLHNYSEDCRLNYQRFVPFEKGDWKHAGGKWFVIFGIEFYFRIGKSMIGGFYFPFTKINIKVSNQWIEYKNWKLKQ